MSKKSIQEIQGFIDGDGTLSQDQYRSWATSEHPEILELVIDAVATANARISPPVDESLYFELLLHAVGVSLTKAPKASELSPYLLSGDLMAFLEDIDDRLPGGAVGEMHRRLEYELRKLALQLPQSGQEALVNAYLEHLLERPDLREVFRLWEKRPDLAGLYEQALEWSG